MCALVSVETITEIRDTLDECSLMCNRCHYEMRGNREGRLNEERLGSMRLHPITIGCINSA